MTIHLGLCPSAVSVHSAHVTIHSHLCSLLCLYTWYTHICVPCCVWIHCSGDDTLTSVCLHTLLRWLYTHICVSGTLLRWWHTHICVPLPVSAHTAHVFENWSSNWWFHVPSPAVLVVVIVLACCRDIRRQVPENYILLALFVSNSLPLAVSLWHILLLPLKVTYFTVETSGAGREIGNICTERVPSLETAFSPLTELDSRSLFVLANLPLSWSHTRTHTQVRVVSAVNLGTSSLCQK